MSAMRERVQPVLAIVRRDLRQIHRHGLPTLLVLTVLLLFLGIIGFSIAGSTLRQIGVPPWTGGIGGGDPLRVNAEASVTSGLAPLSVGFTANTIGGVEPFNVSWTLGDGNRSFVAAPNYVYPNAGVYDVLLAVQNAGGDEPVRSTLRIIAYGPGPWPLQVGIGANRTAGRDSLAVSFTATVVGGNPSAYTYFWEFGDGQNSTAVNPSHVFGPADDVQRVKLTVREGTNVSMSNEVHVSVDRVGGESLPINLLDFVYGYMVLVTMILLPIAFSSNYGGEMKKGTVRALTLYPVGVLEVTVAKLLYAAIAGFLFSFPISVLPPMGIGKPAGDVLGIYAVAYLFSFGIVAVAAFTANLLCYFTKRMYLKPTLMPWLFVLYGFFLTSRIFGFLMGFLAGPGAAGAVAGAAPLITFSPYHQGGLLLSGALGGPGSPDWVVFLIPVLLLVAGVWFSRKLYPDVYEKE